MYLEKPYYPYFFTPIIPTFSLLFSKFLSLLFPYFSVAVHLKAYVQNEGHFLVCLNFKYLFEVLEIPDIFWGER